jgi:transcription elongation factor GreB
MDAPLARALLGRRLDDEVTVELANGPVTYTITAIEYPGDEPG